MHCTLGGKRWRFFLNTTSYFFAETWKYLRTVVTCVSQIRFSGKSPLDVREIRYKKGWHQKFKWDFLSLFRQLRFFSPRHSSKEIREKFFCLLVTSNFFVIVTFSPHSNADDVLLDIVGQYQEKMSNGLFAFSAFLFLSVLCLQSVRNTGTSFKSCGNPCIKTFQKLSYLRHFLLVWILFQRGSHLDFERWQGK